LQRSKRRQTIARNQPQPQIQAKSTHAPRRCFCRTILGEQVILSGDRVSFAEEGFLLENVTSIALARATARSWPLWGTV
jgi:hypothetical protein